MSLLDRLGSTQICLCVGAGGVGKTTTSAALATLLAQRGDRVGLVTIDPAKRLAHALGIDDLGGEPQRVELGAEVEGELWAMMLDPQATFDGLVASLTNDEGSRTAILENPIYQRISGAVAGSQEFTAVAKLYELHRSRRFDVIVLDTPPSRNALDFLDAPDRLTAFVEGRGLTSIIAPSGPLARIAGRGSGLFVGTLGRLTGSGLLVDLQRFLYAFGAVLDGFRDRAAAVKRLLADPNTSFVIVTTPERDPAAEALHFAERLNSSDLQVCALIVNQVTPFAKKPEPIDRAEILSLLDDDEKLTEKVMLAAEETRAIAAREQAEIAGLVSGTGVRDPLIVPRFGGDLHDVAGLMRLSAWLGADDETHAADLAAAAV
jgi:anion-transporting  ArsA/GET3 family ATPase